MESIQEAEADSRKGPRGQANRMTFTELGLSRLKPPEGRQALYWDSGTKGQLGLSLLVSPGGTKTFRSTFYLHGRAISRKLGRFGEMSLTEARKLTAADRDMASKGKDPREGRKIRPTTFEAVVDQFIEQYAKPRQRSWKQTEAVLKRNCKPWLRKPIAGITKTDAYSLLDDIIASGRGPTAGQTLAWLRTLWTWAFKRDIVPSPIMDQVEIEYEKKERDRVYSDDEIKAIWRAADALQSEEGGEYRGAYTKLLLLLAPRKGALAQMRRSHLDDENNPTLWTTPFELTKSWKTAKRRTYLTPLPPLAQRVLKGLKAREDAPDLVFPGRHKGLPIDAGTPLRKKLAELGAPDDFNFHAVRHTVSTWFENEGHGEFERGIVLNHSGKGGVTAGYSHGYPLELKRQLLEKWARHVEKLVTPKGAKLLR